MHDLDDFPEEPEEEEVIKTDKYFIEAYEEIKLLYEQNKKSVFFKRQLQVKYENKYFHWITSNALSRLKAEGYVREIEIKKKDGTSRQFFIHPSNRYYRRAINESLKIIDAYSNSNITRSCGHRAEDLFSLALMERGFIFVGRGVREFKGKKWNKTGHDLDFIFERKGQYWGCEIKNTLGYIDKEELITKIEMCEYFKIRPLFIMRFSPKTYNREIIERGGFSLIFGAQIYDISQKALVIKMKDVLGLQVDCPKAIPEGIINRFINWIEREKT
jgi:hypothetical protein